MASWGRVVLSAIIDSRESTPLRSPCAFGEWGHGSFCGWRILASHKCRYLATLGPFRTFNTRSLCIAQQRYWNFMQMLDLPTAVPSTISFLTLTERLLA